MAEFPDIYSLNYERLQELTKNPDFRNAPPVYRAQALTRLKNLEIERSFNRLQDMGPLEREAQRLQEQADLEATQRRVRREQSARRLRESTQEPAQPSAAPPPVTPTPEDVTSQAMRAVLPPPTLPAGPVVPPDVEQPPGGSRAPEEAPARGAAPTPPQAAPAAGMRAAPTQVGESGEARRARAMGETAELMKGLQEPERKPNIMDSPYTAIINAGLNMLMNAAGRSPLEAIAGGASAGLKTAQEQAMREEARGEKQLERAYKRAEMGVKLRTDLQRVEQEEEKLRAEYEKIKNQRDHYASTAAHQNAMLAVQERLARMGERRNDISEGLLAERERAGTRTEITLMSRTLTSQLSDAEKTIRELEQEAARAPLPAEKTRIQQRITQYEARAKAIRDELAELQQRTPRGGPQPQPARPTSPM